MEKNRFLRMVFLLQIIIQFTGCGLNPRSDGPEYYLVDITGVEFVYNISKSSPAFGSMPLHEEDTVRIVVSGGDMLEISTVEGDCVYYRYNPDDGLSLSFDCDSIYDAVYLNNDLVTICFCDDSVTYQWIENIEAEELSKLRYLAIEESISDREYHILKKISDVNPNPGLFIADNSSARDVLSLFTPEWLYADFIDYNNYSETIKRNLKNLELIWLEGSDSINLDFLYELPKLNSMICQYLDSVMFSGFRFDKLERLRSLSITESDIYDLSSLGAMPELKDLNLVFSESLKDIGILIDYTGLKSIGLLGCEEIKDISVIEKLPELSRFSFPVYFTPEEFSSILEKHTSLQVLEVISDDTLDLGPLAGYTGLKALALGTEVLDLTPVYQLEDLELLKLYETYFEDSLRIVEIQNAMPGTRIVKGGCFCLGSGWILLLIPALLLIVFIKSSRISKHFSRTRQ